MTDSAKHFLNIKYENLESSKKHIYKEVWNEILSWYQRCHILNESDESSERKNIFNDYSKKNLNFSTKINIRSVQITKTSGFYRMVLSNIQRTKKKSKKDVTPIINIKRRPMISLKFLLFKLFKAEMIRIRWSHVTPTWEARVINKIAKKINSSVSSFKRPANIWWNECVKEMFLVLQIGNIKLQYLGILNEPLKERTMEPTIKTEDYEKYDLTKKILNRKKMLEKSFLLHLSFWKHITSLTLKLLPDNPENLIKLDNLRKPQIQNEYDLGYIYGIVKSEIDKFNAEFIIKWLDTLHVDLSSRWAFYGVRDQKMSHVLLLIDEFIRANLMILKKKMNDYIIHTITDQRKISKLKIMIYYEDGSIKISPDISFFIAGYIKIVQYVCNLSRFIESFLIPNKILETATEEYITEKVGDLIGRLFPLFAPVKKYCEILDERFAELNPQFLFGISLQECTKFKRLYAIYRHYERLMKSIRVMPNYEHYNIFRIDQRTLKLQLTSLASLRLKESSVNVLSMIMNDANIVTKALHTLSSRVNKLATCTEELITMGKFMSSGGSMFTDAFRKKVKKIMSRYFRIRHSLTASSTVTIRDMIIAFNELHYASENYKIVFEEEILILEDRLQKETNQLNRDLEEFISEYLDNFNEFDNDEDVTIYAQFVRSYGRMLDNFDSRISLINKEELLLNCSPSTYPELDEIKAIVEPFSELVLFIEEWTILYKFWMEGPLSDLNCQSIENQSEIFNKKLFKYNETYKQKCRQQIADGYARRFTGVVDDPDFNVWPSPIKLISLAQEKMKAIKKHMPTLKILCNKAMKTHHWKEMSFITGFDMFPYGGRALTEYLSHDIETFLDKLQIVSINASKEHVLEIDFEKMKEEWACITFKTVSPKRADTKILGSVDGILNLLDDQLMKTLSMRGSAFIKPIEEQVRNWYNLLEFSCKTIDCWTKVQIQWLNLDSIFSLEDIASQMPKERELFNELDKIYRGIIKDLETDANVIRIIQEKKVAILLDICTQKLNIINAGVIEFLEKIRCCFPRFFFLSNKSMLEILAQIKNPLKIQSHLKYCFQGISKLGFDEEFNIYSMISEQGEEIIFENAISTIAAKGSVEKWLIQVEKQMIESVKQKIFDSCYEYKSRTRIDWIKNWQSQIVLCVAQIYWTSQVHHIFKRPKRLLFQKYLTGLKLQLNKLIKYISKDITEQIRITIEALIILDIHAKDVVEKLIDNHIMESRDFQWQSQLRYYLWEKHVYACITNVTIKYACEYLGNTNRLVVTPLTDRCYRALIAAFHLHLNNIVEGPAATGKTETVKDLAKAIAVKCFVFNCSDKLDYSTMIKFFKGLALCGAWACFDEFNLIPLHLLSVLAQQVYCVVQAVRDHAETLVLEGTILKLNKTVHICVTMNNGYGKRMELPDNLKVFFRTITIMVPDYAMITEVSLYSNGYLNAKELSVKMLTTFKLCSEQLSSQPHYDYGLLSMKTVLSKAGKLKRKYKDTIEETELIMRSFFDVNFSKLIQKDILTFQEIILDLFPNIDTPPQNFNFLKDAVKTVCLEKGLQLNGIFLAKIIQTYEMMYSRHGFALVGDAFSGKTCLLNVLANALTLMEQRGQDERKTCFLAINPKSVTPSQLYGYIDESSAEWCDGIISNYFRKFAVCDTPDRKWLIFDGPVDAGWIENMNTILDDNRKLCLNSGEIIKMGPAMSIIFEVMDLMQASPAIISRCGMIFVEGNMITWRILIESLMESLPMEWRKGNEECIFELFDWLIPFLIEFLQKCCHKIVNAGISSIVKTCFIIMRMIMKSTAAKSSDISNLSNWIQAAFFLSIIWGIGGILDDKSKEILDIYLRKLWNGEHNLDKIKDKIELVIPKEGNLHDYMFTFRGRGEFTLWSDVVKVNKFEDVQNIRTAFIPTVETSRYLWIMTLHVNNKVPFLLIGPSCTGKTFYIRHMLMTELPLAQFNPSILTFSPSLTANQTQAVGTPNLHTNLKIQVTFIC